MSEKICPIIKPDQLLKLKGVENLRIFDASNNPQARASFAARHLEGAAFVDINSQLADIKSTPADGGRHPLPSPAKFAATLRELGISPDSHVVVYDDKNGANAAARFWWMLRAVGHAQAQVLDGGIDAAVRAGFPVADGAADVVAGAYDADAWTLPTVAVDEVENASTNGGALIVDVRETPRYNGETEPFDKIAGHIPNAVNIPFAENLDADGFFLPPEVLREKYARALAGRDDVIVHCGSGVTACHTLLALDYAGLEIPKLYVGSWSEWSSRGLPVATA
ncbi:MAG: sulfurtransferase [Acidobacteria bacterium]|nr:sulfurtransferase [Acidobacteriota bacterium]